MKNNKGFSLVELIIVIAIMAILVGVLAPNLIKQLEKAKVSSDMEVCDTVVTAMTVAINDCATLPNSAQSATIALFYTTECDVSDCDGSDSLADAFKEALGCDLASVATSLKSSGAEEVTIFMDSNQQIKAWIDGTDSTGSKKNTSNTISVN